MIDFPTDSIPLYARSNENIVGIGMGRTSNKTRSSPVVVLLLSMFAVMMNINSVHAQSIPYQDIWANPDDKELNLKYAKQAIASGELQDAAFLASMIAMRVASVPAADWPVEHRTQAEVEELLAMPDYVEVAEFEKLVDAFYEKNYK